MSRTPLFAALAALLGCGHAAAPNTPPPVAALTVSPGPVKGEPLLQPSASLASAAGAGALRLLGASFVQEGDRIGSFIEVPADECALAFARGTTGLVEVDILSFEDSGDPVVNDESTGAEATILICPPHPRRLYVQARAVAGSGRLALGAQPVPPSASLAVAKATEARGLPGSDSGRYGAAWAGLEGRVAERRRALGSRWVDVRRAVLPLDARAATRISLTVAPGRCLDAFLSPGADVGAIDVAVEDSDGRIVAVAAALGRDRAAVLCSSVEAQVNLSVRPRASQGLVAVVVGESDAGAAAELRDPIVLSASRDMPAARAAWDAARRAEGAAPPTTLASGTARVGELTGTSVDLPAGCARVDVLAASPLAGVSATLWDASGARIGAGTGGSVASLFTCAPAAHKAQIDVEALSRPGPFSVELRPEIGAPPLLTEQPIAAARLLDRALAGAIILRPSAYTVRKLELRAAQRVDVPFTVLEASCVDVIAALGSGARGLSMNLSAPGGLVRSQLVVAQRLCAGERAPLHAKAELSVETGQSAALFAVVPSAP